VKWVGRLVGGDRICREAFLNLDEALHLRLVLLMRTKSWQQPCALTMMPIRGIVRVCAMTVSSRVWRIQYQNYTDRKKMVSSTWSVLTKNGALAIIWPSVSHGSHETRRLQTRQWLVPLAERNEPTWCIPG
jgi:hypothetical protein